MSLILDATIVAIVLICAIIAAKKGFVRALIEFVGYILAVVIAVSVGGIIADITYEKVLMPAVSDAIAQSISDTGSNTIENLPGSVVSIIELAGVDLEEINSSIGETADKTAIRITETAVKPIAIGLVKSISVIIIAVLLFIIVGLLAKALNAMFKGVIFGSANKLLGAILGCAKGLVFSAVFCLIVNFIASVTATDFFFFSTEAVEGSILGSYILNFISTIF